MITTGLQKVTISQKKLPVHCCSKILTRYKRNAIMGELHQTKWIVSHFNFEAKCIKKFF